ncbi:carbohydrate-binding module family 13 protein [Rhizophagus irregularis DAOM 181602=DAOM 197198]|nr:carbohydrate-binding module family 13 protein [Rhizophagus irregularis DAOM 181602=DAOM 197198]
MVILSYRSPYLRRILSTNKKKNDGTLVNIKLSNIKPEIFQIILKYIYGGKKILISLIQNDNLQISEVQIWEHVLKWGIAQNPELSSDSSSYSEDDFNNLKNNLQQCIPLIKFIKFTSKEFLNKVYPYKKIIPKQLYKSLIECFLDNDYNPSDKLEPKIIKETTISESIDSKSDKLEPKIIKETTISEDIDSKIITIQHAKLISKWIDKSEIADEAKNLYEFKLILRGSHDGFTPKEFHKICDNQFRTVTIIKVKGSNEILGGYNPIEWKSGNSYDENLAINYWDLYGPSFGHGDLSINIYGGNSFRHNGNYCKNYSYEKNIRKTEDLFSVEEYEVFQIMEKLI